jgi:hypothetical protein
MRRISVLLSITTTACGFVQEVPRQPTPAQALPTIDNPPPPIPDRGMITLATNEGPAAVEEILAQNTSSAYASGPGGTASSHGFSESTAPVCTTPCVAYLPYGSHQLRFTLKRDPMRVSSDTVAVGAKPSVFNYNVGTLDSSRRGALVIGWTSAALGYSLAAGGVAAAAVDSSAGPPLLVIGLAMGVVGSLVALRSRIKVGGGAGVQWTPKTEAAAR